LLIQSTVIGLSIAVNRHQPERLFAIIAGSDAAQDGTCPARAVVPSGHGTTARAMKKN
jgi:hypothetical protein